MTHHIAFAKIGKSIKFKSAFSPVGGDNEAPAVLKALANNAPDTKFYIVGRSDFCRLTDSERLEIFPYDNVIDIWAGGRFKTFSDRRDYNDPFYHHVTNFFKERDISLSYCVLMVGQVGTVTIPGRIERVRDRSQVASTIDMTLNYSSPITVWLNETKIPYVEIVNDPRYVMNQARDIFHLPAVSLGQYDWEYTANHIKSYEDQDRVETKVASTYAGMETAFCIGRKMPEIDKIPKSRHFAVVLNEGDPSRYDMLKEWVLGGLEDVEVYGRWSHKMAQPDMDTRFKGSIDLEEVQEIMRDTKYTLIIPIRDGWVTSKYIEMIHAGVIPFFHPSYDRQHHTGVPLAIRPKSPEDMFHIIERLESTPGAREELLRILQKRILKPEYYDGSFIAKRILEAGHKQIGMEYVPADLAKYTPVKSISLDDFF